MLNQVAHPGYRFALDAVLCICARDVIDRIIYTFQPYMLSSVNPQLNGESAALNGGSLKRRLQWQSQVFSTELYSFLQSQFVFLEMLNPKQFDLILRN